MSAVEDARAHGNALFARGEYAEAVAVFTSLLTASSSPDSPQQLHSNLSACELKLNRPERAVAHATACVRIAPQWPKGHYRLLLALLAHGRSAAAFRAVHAAQLALSPNDFAAIRDVVVRVAAQHTALWYASLTANATVRVQWIDETRGKGLFLAAAATTVTPGVTLFTEVPLASHRWVQLESELALESCAHCMAVRLTRSVLGDKAADVFLPLLPPQSDPVSCGAVCCTARFCSERCRRDALDQYHAAMCANDDGERAALVAELEKLASDTDRTNVLLIARLLARSLQALHAGRAETIEDALQSLDNFVFYAAPGAGDYRLQEILTKLLLPFDSRAAEMCTIEWIRRINGILLSNSSELNPVTMLHLLLAQTEPQERRALLRRAGFAAHVENIVEIPELKALCLRGTGLYAVINTANHSCAPNAAAASTTVDHSLALIAQSAVRGGDEITISYCDENLPRSKRRAHLREQYHFDCNCPRCAQTQN
jgi:tetratricopeptide (TPR) repeat protein